MRQMKMESLAYSIAAEEAPSGHVRDRTVPVLIRPFDTRTPAAEKPFVANEASGFRIRNAEGREILDGISGMWHVPLGYNHPELLAAIFDQYGRLSASSLFSVSHEPAVHYADALCRALGLTGWLGHLTNNGADAVEAAIRFACQAVAAEGRAAAVQALPGGFHGNSHYLRSLPRTPVPLDWPTTSCPVIVVEPVQGVAGVRAQSAETVAALAGARVNGAIVIADETGSGMWRTGPALAAHGLRVDPDLVVVSKGLTNGVIPLGVALVSPGIAARIGAQPWEDGRTTGGSPLACATGLSVLSVFERAGGAAERTSNAARLGETALRIAARFDGIVRHCGMMAGIELPIGAPLDVVQRARANGVFIANGVLARFAADGRTLNLAPGYTYSEKDFSELESSVTISLEKLFHSNLDSGQSDIFTKSHG